MKYVVMLGDGMADEPLEELGGRTPLEYADTPTLDALARVSQIGTVRTVPEGMAPGSDTANLSVIGYDPRKYYTGRSPLEALSIGVPMKPDDVALRCNLVTLSDDTLPYGEKTILDHSASEISTEEAAVLLRAAEEAFAKMEGKEAYHFYTGTSYRHCLIWEKGQTVHLTPPHDVLGRRIGPYLPEDAALKFMQEKSYEILKEHPINRERRAKGLHPANSLWFWGAGTRPALDRFEELYHKRGVMISAVDLLKGIAVGAGMDNRTVEGANGGLDTNYEGKAQAAVDALLREGYDFAYIHLEAPDEMGHQGSAERKTEAIHRMDTRLLAHVKRALDASGEPYRLLVLPDHPTPVRLRTHTADPVPYLLYDSGAPEAHAWSYCEREAMESAYRVERGCELMPLLFSR